MLGPSGHVDTFTRDRLPPNEQLPNFLLEGFEYPKYINAGYELSDSMVAKGFGNHIALIGNTCTFSYRELAHLSNQFAHVLVDNLGVQPGNRILIRSANNPAMVACWLAVTKVGAVAVNTIPMLRAGELKKIVDKAEISHALCDRRLLDELKECATRSPCLKTIASFDGNSTGDAELDQLAAKKPTSFNCRQTGRDDVALLGFTSGTTGEPKATMHFHRDLLLIADGYAHEILRVQPNDIFVGTPPLAFTFGLGGLAVFPLRFGAAAVLLEHTPPAEMATIIQKYKATVCFTAPTAYRTILENITKNDEIASLRVAVSAGETLPSPVYKDWKNKTGVPILDGIGATEMLHVFISNRLEDSQPGSTGKVVSGYKACIVDDNMNEVADGEPGQLAVQGPTGCRYLDDNRQCMYVRNGWNIIGDVFWKDEKGSFHFAGRSDDMIVSSGYNIAGPEVEAALLSHKAVRECAVVGIPDKERGMIVQAHIVLKKGVKTNEQLVKNLQEHVKSTIAPYKYPRSILFTNNLPKTPTGKIQRFLLKHKRQA